MEQTAEEDINHKPCIQENKLFFIVISFFIRYNILVYVKILFEVVKTCNQLTGQYKRMKETGPMTLAGPRMHSVIALVFCSL